MRSMVRGGATVLLTTQNLDEADQLAGQISLIDSGRVVAEGPPDQLKSRIGGDRIDIVLHDVDQLPGAAAAIARMAGARAEIDFDTRRVSAPVREGRVALAEVVRALDAEGIDAQDIALRRPT